MAKFHSPTTKTTTEIGDLAATLSIQDQAYVLNTLNVLLDRNRAERTIMQNNNRDKLQEDIEYSKGTG